MNLDCILFCSACILDRSNEAGKTDLMTDFPYMNDLCRLAMLQFVDVAQSIYNKNNIYFTYMILRLEKQNIV
jgi:hypothetical protein